MRDDIVRSIRINWHERQATCPSGQASRYWTVGLDNNGRDAIRIRFATTTCSPCPVRDQCTRSTQYGRQLTVRPEGQDALLERVRAEQTTKVWKERYAARAGIEGTIHQAVAVGGMRRTPLSRPGQDTPQPCSDSRCSQLDPARRLVARHPTRPDQNFPACGPRTQCMNQLGNRVIEGWYNLHRLHSSLGYRSPAEYETTLAA
ncbi:transposase [Streptomyces sp. NPDC005195]|uniref:transposase n=1 Tax=Streptomyces sp. NPDC005195 TaxID=3154561 RepID=UPI0033A1EBAC